MSADAPTVAPTKRCRRAWLIGLAVVVAVVTFVLLANAPRSEPVKVWFVRTTNEASVKKLVFEGTNGISGVDVLVSGIRTGAVLHARTIPAWNPFHDVAVVRAPVGTNFFFTLNAPPKDVPYYVEWQFLEKPRALTRLESFRRGCESFFRKHGMRGLALRFAVTPHKHYIPSTEIKE